MDIVIGLGGGISIELLDIVGKRGVGAAQIVLQLYIKKIDDTKFVYCRVR